MIGLKTLTICFFKLISRILFQFLAVSLGADASSDNNPQSVVSLKVTRSSTLEVKRVLYTVPSRLIGENVRVHVYHDRLAFLWDKR